MTAVDGSLESRWAHGVGPEPRRYLAAGDALWIGSAEGDVDAVVTGVDALTGAATWESISGRQSGVTDMEAGS